MYSSTSFSNAFLDRTAIYSKHSMYWQCFCREHYSMKAWHVENSSNTAKNKISTRDKNTWCGCLSTAGCRHKVSLSVYQFSSSAISTGRFSFPRCNCLIVLDRLSFGKDNTAWLLLVHLNRKSLLWAQFDEVLNQLTCAGRDFRQYST